MIGISELRKLIENISDINAWEIRNVVNESYQLFYVSDSLETNRYVNTDEMSVTVYADSEGLRGSSAAVITSADDEESITGKLNAAVRKAKQALNPYYPLAEKTENLNRVSSEKQDLAGLAKDTADAVFAAEAHENSQLNATEIGRAHV